MAKLIKKISNHALTGQKRGIKLKQIAYIDFDLQEAKIIWEEMVLDDLDEAILSNLIPTRLLTSVLSNNNKVTAQGITLNKEYIERINPIGADENQEDYDTRVEGLLNIALEKGTLEFDFYIDAILNLGKISQAVTLLDTLKRFDK